MALSFTITIDRVGFPLIETPELPFAVLWLPVTKIQFEHFLVDTEYYNNDWYQERLRDGRISAGGVSVSNYWQLFMTSILPKEAQKYAQWCGPGFDLPTSKQWKDALNVFAKQPADEALLQPLLNASQVSERARQIMRVFDTITWQEVWQLAGERRMCDQMGMRLGVMEIVYESNQRTSFGCWGQPNKRLHGAAVNPLLDRDPMLFVDRMEGARMRYGGFRLIRSK